MQSVGMCLSICAFVCFLGACFCAVGGSAEAASPSRLVKTNRMLVVRLYAERVFKLPLRVRDQCVKRGPILARMKDRVTSQFRSKGLLSCRRKGYARSRIVPSILKVRSQGRLSRRTCHFHAAVSTICSRYELLGRRLKATVLSFPRGDNKRARYAMTLAKRKVQQGFLKRLARQRCNNKMRGSLPIVKVLSFWRGRASQGRTRPRRCRPGRCKSYISVTFDLKCIEATPKGL